MRVGPFNTHASTHSEHADIHADKTGARLAAGCLRLLSFFFLTRRLIFLALGFGIALWGITACAIIRFTVVVVVVNMWVCFEGYGMI